MINQLNKLVSYHKNNVLREIRDNNKNCLICEEEVSSFANSHSIPKFSLKAISKKGLVYGRSAFTLNGELLRDMNSFRVEYFKSGINNSGIFKAICQDCEQKSFVLIEHEHNFNKTVWDIDQKKQIMLKSLSYEYSSKLFTKYLYKDLKRNELDYIINYYNDETESIRTDVKKIDLLKSDEILTLVELNLDFNIGFSINTIIFPNIDGNLNIINNKQPLFIHLISKKDCTKIIMFTETKHHSLHSIKNDLESMFTINEKLNYIIRLILLFSDRIYYQEDFLIKNKEVLNNYLIINTDFALIKDFDNIIDSNVKKMFLEHDFIGNQ